MKKCGKVPVVLKRDFTGFIANRLQAALLREACYLIKEGVADAESIDTVVTESIGLRWALKGPFATIDYGGLDIWQKVLENLLPILDRQIEVPDMIVQKNKNNHLGLKTGIGFFDYQFDDRELYLVKQKDQLEKLLDVKKIIS